MCTRGVLDNTEKSKFLTLPGLELQLQMQASRYTDCATVVFPVKRSLLEIKWLAGILLGLFDPEDKGDRFPESVG
jgi:hypothetical protein